MTNEEKYKKVLYRNTFFFLNKEFESEYEGYVNSIKSTLLMIKDKVIGKKDEEIKKIYQELLLDKENGLRAILAITGFSHEYLKRMLTVIRISDNEELAKLVLKDKWGKTESPEAVSEWSDEQLYRMLKTNLFFRQGLVNLFFEGETVSYLVKRLPYFELKKLSAAKLKFEIPDIIDTIIRYKEKGSYSGQKENNPEIIIEAILGRNKISYARDKLPRIGRRLDFIIPNKQNPRIVIECSFVVTTSSGLGDKAKTERDVVARQIEKYYPGVRFWGFVDGVGWLVRKGDLKIITEAFEEVFTFHRDELKKFENMLIETFKK